MAWRLKNKEQPLRQGYAFSADFYLKAMRDGQQALCFLLAR